MKKYKPKKLAFIVDIDIYRVDLRFSFGENDKDVKRFLDRQPFITDEEKKETVDAFNEPNTNGLCSFYKNGVGMIRMREVPIFPADYACLHHEITHYVMLMLHSKGMKHCPKTTEAFAYLTEFITSHAYEKIFAFNK